MSSSNESEDESIMSKSSMSKKEVSNSYLTLINKFSEMLKNKIKQIGTPVELKRKKHVKKHADVINHRDKDFPDVIVKKEKSSEDSDSERKVSKKRKLKIVKKKEVSHAESESSDEVTSSKTRDEEIITSNKSTKVQKRKHANDHEASTSDSEDEASKSRLQHPKSSVTKGKSHNNNESSTSSEEERQQSKKHSDNDRSNKTPSSRLRKLELNDSLTSIPNCFDSFNNIKSKEDVYIIQIPLKLDPNRLINKSISLNGHIRVNKKYDSIASHQPQEPIMICTNTESANVKIIQPVGSITLQRRLESTEIPDVLDKSVAFPTNLKSRHPLFGSHFDNKITLEEHVKMKLESVRDSPVKKKKKKEKRHRMEETKHQEEEIFKFLSQGNEESERVEKKKKKKRRNSEERHEAGGSKKRRKEEVEEEVPKKKKKHKEDSGESLIQELLSVNYR